MNDIDAWLLFDGPEPEHLRPLLDALYGLTPGAPEEEEEREGRQSSEGLNAEPAQGEAPSVATAAPIAPIAPAPGDGRVGEFGVTARSPSFDERPAAPPPVEPPSLQVAAPEPRPPEGRPPVEDPMRITSVAVDVPAEFRKQMATLPFKPRAPGTELARTMKVPELNRWQGQTAPLDTSIAKAVAALPFVGSTVGAAVVPFPRLTVEAYASLRAELSVGPERSAEIRRRYHVMNEAALRALDEHWEVALAASPATRATFDKLLAEYTAWVRSQRG